MFDHDLDTVAVRRVVALKRFALVDGVELGELATLAYNVVETTFEPGEPVTAGPAAVHFVLAGSIVTAGAPPSYAGDVFGALELLANRPQPADARAAGPTRTLRLDAADLFEVLDDNFGLLAACVRAVAALGSAAPWPAISEPLPAISTPLGLVERLLLLRRQAPLARARIRALTTLAHASHEVAWSAGTVIVRGGDLATSSYVIVDGSVRTDAGLVHAGGTFGLVEMLAGGAHRETIEAATPVRALASSQAALFDVLEDHTDLGFAVLAVLAGEALNARAALARTPAP